VLEMPDLSFAGTFFPADDVAVGAAQWQGFGDLSNERVRALMLAFNASSWPTSFSSELDQAALRFAALPIPDDEPRGVRLSAGYGREALVGVRDSTPEMVAIYPSFGSAERYWFRLDSVDLSPDRLQMRANGELLTGLGDDAPGTRFSWYVLDPVEVRELLRRGRAYQIGLTGLCYTCTIAQNHVLQEAVTPELRRAWTESGIPALVQRAAGDTYTLDLSEMKTLVSGGMNGDARLDDAMFRGRVRSAVKLRAPIAECAGWKLRVDVIDWENDETLCVTLVVTEQAWSGAVPPRRGQFVEGWAWMQGSIAAVIRAPGEVASSTG
jgi:hypothetical protein